MILIETDPKFRILHEQLHKLWTASAGNPGYVKKEWQRLEEMLFEHDRRVEGAEAALSLQTDKVIRLEQELRKSADLLERSLSDITSKLDAALSRDCKTRVFEGVLGHEDEMRSQDAYVIVDPDLGSGRIAYWQEWVKNLYGRPVRITVEDLGP